MGNSTLFMNNTMETESSEDNVYYCKNCLSLAIKGSDMGIDFCDDCGSTDIGECSFEQWNEFYNKRYNKEFLKTKQNGSNKR